MWSNEALMALHVQAMFTCTDKGALLTVNEPWDGSRPAPLLFVGIPEGSPPLCWERADLPASLVAAARSLTEQEPLPVSALEKLLGKPLAAERERCFYRPAGKAPLPHGSLEGSCVELTPERLRSYTLGEFSWLEEELPAASPCFAFCVGKEVVAVCRSVRKGSAHEAGVETAPAYRRKGIGSLLVTAWSNAVEQSGNIPLYSALESNAASLSCAKKGGFLPYGQGVSFYEAL